MRSKILKTIFRGIDVEISEIRTRKSDKEGV